MSIRTDHEAVSRDVRPGSGDLGRRLKNRRGELGLSRGDVAHRAGMDPGYLEYVEENAGEEVSAAASYRLAAALGTTVPRLQGEGFDSATGSGRIPAGFPELEVLDLATCTNLLRRGGIGRVIFHDESGLAALPVNFKMLSHDLVFHTGEGSMAGALRRGGSLGLEVDNFDPTLAEGWSVLVRGHATVVTDPAELHLVGELMIESWTGELRPIIVRLSAEEVTGRRIRRSLCEEDVSERGDGVVRTSGDAIRPLPVDDVR